MKVNTIVIFLTVLFKYTQIYMNSTINPISIGILGFIVFNVILILKNKKIKNSKAFIFLLIASFIIMIIAQDPNFILPFLVAIILQDEPMEKVISKFLVCSVLMFGLTIILSEMNIIKEQIEWTKLDAQQKTVQRSTLGFSNPNTCFLFAFGILLLYYLKKGKLTIIESIIWVFALTVLYKLTLSRTGYYVSLLFIVTNEIVKRLNKYKVMKFLYRHSFIIFTMISILIAYKFGTSFNRVEGALSHRPIFWLQNVQVGMSLMGKDSGIVLDNYMLNILIKQGIMVYAIYAFLFYYLIKKLQSNPQHIKYEVVVIYTIIYAISESSINISNNIVILLLFAIYFSNEFEEKKEKQIEREKESIIFDK